MYKIDKEKKKQFVDVLKVANETTLQEHVN